MRIELPHSIIRPWSLNDADDLSKNANNPKIAASLDDDFPQPYVREDAVQFIKSRLKMDPVTHFAIEFQGQAIGAIGFDFRIGAQRTTVDLGYWIGEDYWGQGICTETVQGITEAILRDYSHIQRIQASVFEWNFASCRVLEKSGFFCDGHHRNAIIKYDRIGNLLIYGKIRS